MAPGPRRARRALLLASIVCTGLAAGLSACGATNEELQSHLAAVRGRALQPVDADDVARQPSGSPQRTVMELWRALQFRDAQRAGELVTREPEENRLRREQSFLSFAEPAARARPRVVAVRPAVRGARMDVEIALRQMLGSQAIKTTRTDVEFVAQREDGRWKLLFDRRLIRELGEAMR